MCGVRAEEEVSNLTVVSRSWAGICRGEQTVINQRLTVAQTLAGWECVSAYVSVRLGPVSLSACEVCVCAPVSHGEKRFQTAVQKVKLGKENTKEATARPPRGSEHYASSPPSWWEHLHLWTLSTVQLREGIPSPVVDLLCVWATPSQSFFFLAGSAWSSFKRSELAELFNNMAVRGIVMST